ncbi:crAss001_48 related protein [Rosenbergiella metrosideri]|uniref:crAss001_48 related protein n=2 Tax=Rosenbergiella TaxID=1356488 RepID=UPI003BA842C5
MSHLDRVKTEKEELEVKAGSLAVFIYKSETFKALSTEKQNTLKAQLSVMQSYISILELRLTQG